jgi:hypothetical protein
MKALFRILVGALAAFGVREALSKRKRQEEKPEPKRIPRFVPIEEAEMMFINQKPWPEWFSVLFYRHDEHYAVFAKDVARVLAPHLDEMSHEEIWQQAGRCAYQQGLLEGYCNYFKRDVSRARSDRDCVETLVCRQSYGKPCHHACWHPITPNEE